MRIVLADGFLVFRMGMAAVLNNAAGMTVVGEAADVHSALQAVDTAQPDLCILAANLPGGALAAARQIKTTHRHVRILLMVELQSEVNWYAALGAPVDGYLTRAAGMQELLSALNTCVAAG